MTGIVNNFQNQPRYQRLIQKFSALRPDQRAILDTAMLDEKFAGDEMKKYMTSIMTAADLANKSRSLDLQEKEYTGKEALFREGQDFEKKQDRLGNYIGAATLPLSGYFGYRGAKAGMEEAEATKAHRKRIEDLLGVGV